MLPDQHREPSDEAQEVGVVVDLLQTGRTRRLDGIPDVPLPSQRIDRSVPVSRPLTSSKATLMSLTGSGCNVIGSTRVMRSALTISIRPLQISMLRSAA